MNPLVSVIIPTYNREDLLARAMQSVKNQTFKDWELIVVDDCSTDGTCEMVSSWSWTDKRVRYVKTPWNSGSPVMPRNTGVEVARGRWLAFLDSDDTWHPRKLETQLEFMRLWKTQFSFHDVDVVYPDRKEQWSQMATMHSGHVFPFLLRKNFVVTSSVMVERELLLSFNVPTRLAICSPGVMDPALKISHDWELWLRIAWARPIYGLPVVLGRLQIHEGSVISSVHARRTESRKVIRMWKGFVPISWYYKILLYYYLMEGIDVLPRGWSKWIRRVWYKQSRFKGGK